MNLCERTEWDADFLQEKRYLIEKREEELDYWSEIEDQRNCVHVNKYDELNKKLADGVVTQDEYDKQKMELEFDDEDDMFCLSYLYEMESKEKRAYQEWKKTRIIYGLN